MFTFKKRIKRFDEKFVKISERLIRSLKPLFFYILKLEPLKRVTGDLSLFYEKIKTYVSQNAPLAAIFVKKIYEKYQENKNEI